MTNHFVIGIIVILVILVVIAAIGALFLRADLIECENNESPYCPQFTCPTTNSDGTPGGGKPAQRTTADGKVVYST